MDEKTMEISNFREMKPENTTKKKPKILRHEEIMEQIHDTYIQKNRAYGNSFDQSCDDFGISAAMVRMSDKWNRLKTLTKDSSIPQGDESIKDTLLDLANYCVMTYMWLEEKENDYE